MNRYAAITIFVFAFSAVGLTALINKKQNKISDPKIMQSPSDGLFEPVAVLELFTSQGCSSCPSADRLLAKTISKNAGKNIFAISLHVDYWNRLGWKDPFSSAAFSQRQSWYVSKLKSDGPYTPQLVVNGKSEFVGSDEKILSRELANALNTKSKIRFSNLSFATENNGDLKINYAIEGNYKSAVINIVLVSTEETTMIKKGENAGITLKNENVARSFISKDAEATGSVNFSKNDLPPQNNFSVIAYVQDKESGAIIGAASVK